MLLYINNGLVELDPSTQYYVSSEIVIDKTYINDQQYIILYQFDVLDNYFLLDILRNHDLLLILHLRKDISPTTISNIINKTMLCEDIILTEILSKHVYLASSNKTIIIDETSILYCQQHLFEQACRIVRKNWNHVCRKSHIMFVVDINTKNLSTAYDLSEHIRKYEDDIVSNFNQSRHQKSVISIGLPLMQLSLNYATFKSNFKNILYRSTTSPQCQLFNRILRSPTNIFEQLTTNFYTFKSSLYLEHPKVTLMDIFNYLDLFITPTMWSNINSLSFKNKCEKTLSILKQFVC